MQLASELRVVIRHLRAGPPAARVAEKRDVSAWLQSDARIGDDQLPELNEVVAASARSELRPRTVLHLRGQGRHGPVLVHDVVLPRRSKGRAYTEVRFTFERAG